MFVKYHSLLSLVVRSFKQIRERDNNYFLSNIFYLDLTQRTLIIVWADLKLKSPVCWRLCLYVNDKLLVCNEW